MRKGSRGLVTPFELLYFGGCLGKVRLEGLAKCLPRKTLGSGYGLAERCIGLLMLRPPIDFVNARGTTPSTVESVS
ncbi:hypothetical protein G6F56_014349 [Rhizopus delemar]|nr:hypothetical protein G6F56_014349 [Rhizopus delemar]